MPETLSKPKIAKESLQRLDTIRGRMDEERRPFLEFWKRYADKVNPQAGDFEDVEPGQRAPKERSAVYDNTAQKASDILANGLQSAAFGRGVPWIQTTPEDRDLAKDRDAGEFLQKCDLLLASSFSASPFYDEARPFCKSASDFGTGIMFREVDPTSGRPIYRTQHLKRSLIAEDRFGQTDTLFRDFYLAAWEAAEKFGKDNLPQDVKNDLDDKDTLTKRRKYRQYIIPRDKYDLDFGGRSDGKPFYTVFVCETDTEKAIMEGGYERRPFYVWRWGRSLDGDVWGVDAPGMIEYSNQLQANATKADFSRIIQLAARPIIKKTDGVAVRQEPGYHVMLKPGQDFAPVVTTGPVDGMLEDLNQLRGSIRESYQVQFFLTLQANLERVKTATEVSAIKGENAAQLAAMTGRLFYEFLEPAVEDLFELEYTYGRLPPVPDSLKGAKLRIDLVSPLAQLQKRYMMLNETDEFMARMLNVAQTAPQVMDKVDLDKYADAIAEAYHQDKRVVRDLADVQNIRKLRAQQQEAMQVSAMQNERAKAQAAMIQAGGKAPEQGSPVAAMMGQEGGQA